MNTTTTVTLDAADAVELAEVLEWLCDWFGRDYDTLNASMQRFSFGLFDLDEIDRDLRRFAFLCEGRP